LVVAGAWPSLPLPWWVAQAVPPIVYGVLVRLCVRRVSASRGIGATLFLWAVHVVLGVLTGAAVARFGSSAVDLGAAGAFPPPPPSVRQPSRPRPTPSVSERRPSRPLIGCSTRCWPARPRRRSCVSPLIGSRGSSRPERFICRSTGWRRACRNRGIC